MFLVAGNYSYLLPQEISKFSESSVVKRFYVKRGNERETNRERTGTLLISEYLPNNYFGN